MKEQKNRNIAALLILIVSLVMLSGCGIDNRDTVAPKTERVTLQRAYAFPLLWRTEGIPVINGPWTMQKYNHGDGPCVAYDFDMSIQTYVVTMKIKTKDNLNLPVTFEMSWQMKENSSLIAALNFLPTDRIGRVLKTNGGQVIAKRFTPGTGNNIEKIKVPVELIFERNVQDFFDEVGRDVVDVQLSKAFNRKIVARDVMIELEKRLRSVRLPEVRYEAGKGVIFPDVHYEGTELIYSGPTVCALDIIDINQIVVSFENPDFINKQIIKTNELETTVSGLRSDLMGWATKKETRLTEARHARQTALNIKAALALNPLMPQLQRYNNWKKIIAEAKEGNNTRFRFVPVDMYGRTMFDFGSGMNSDGKFQQ